MLPENTFWILLSRKISYLIFSLKKIHYIHCMKRTFLIFAFAALIFASSCYTTRTAGNSGKVPPGQAKKRYGSKSARPFAPGQSKKY